MSINNELLVLFEKKKSIIKSLSELEIALNTFYGESNEFNELFNLYTRLKEYKECYID